jgi:hypothetical protein
MGRACCSCTAVVPAYRYGGLFSTIVLFVGLSSKDDASIPNCGNHEMAFHWVSSYICKHIEVLLACLDI